MNIHTNIPLKNYTTMQLGGGARFFADVHTAEELQQLYLNAKSRNLPVFILGGGSNVIARDEGFDGLVMRIRIPGFSVVDEDTNSRTITIGAGENWDAAVQRTVDLDLTGIEAMSAIPGTAGATPVQNVGAYGQEISDTLVSVSAYDTTTNTFVTLTNEQCKFSYRHSIFRGEATGRYIITAITLRLSKNFPAPPFYESLQSYLTLHNITQYTAQTIRDAVTAIRAEKLPDPSKVANTGSFFKNALVERWLVADLQKQFPDMRAYEMDNDIFKVPSGWLIEKAGLKGAIFHGMRVYDKNALVLINESASGHADLVAAREEIIAKVRDAFRITIEQEPLELQ